MFCNVYKIWIRGGGVPLKPIKHVRRDLLSYN